jgi:hypothetical protein
MSTASDGVRSPDATALSKAADAAIASAMDLIGGNSNLTGRSFRAGRIRSRHSRSAVGSPSSALVLDDTPVAGECSDTQALIFAPTPFEKDFLVCSGHLEKTGRRRRTENRILTEFATYAGLSIFILACQEKGIDLLLLSTIRAHVSEEGHQLPPAQHAVAIAEAINSNTVADVASAVKSQLRCVHSIRVDRNSTLGHARLDCIKVAHPRSLRRRYTLQEFCEGTQAACRLPRPELVIRHCSRSTLPRTAPPNLQSVHRNVRDCAKLWSEWQDLNLRPPRPERGALPDCATLRYGWRGLIDLPLQGRKCGY